MKGNMLLGMARGSIGDVVYARVKGQQVGHARNRAPLNPKTKAQMMQRSLFIDCVKFFHRGEQNFFKFAFENKKGTQSDFNAFVKNNVKRGVHITQAQYDCGAYPALGKWMMTKGSLNALQFSFTETGDWELLFNSQTEDVTTVGKLSKALEDTYFFKDGDIITFVGIETDESYEYPDLNPTDGAPVNWQIVQFKLDSSSETLISSVFTGFMYQPTTSVTQVLFETSSAEPCSMCICVSRKTADGLKVNNSYLVPNAVAVSAIEDHESESYIEDVMEAWGATDPSILEGSLVQ